MRRIVYGCTPWPVYWFKKFWFWIIGVVNFHFEWSGYLHFLPQVSALLSFWMSFAAKRFNLYHYVVLEHSQRSSHTPIPSQPVMSFIWIPFNLSKRGFDSTFQFHFPFPNFSVSSLLYNGLSSVIILHQLDILDGSLICLVITYLWTTSASATSSLRYF